MNYIQITNIHYTITEFCRGSDEVVKLLINCTSWCKQGIQLDFKPGIFVSFGRVHRSQWESALLMLIPGPANEYPRFKANSIHYTEKLMYVTRLNLNCIQSIVLRFVFK